VNQRFLDVNFRLPEFVRHLEVPLREKLRKTLSRGKCDISLRLSNDNQAERDYAINEPLVKTLTETHGKIAALAGNSDRLSTTQLMQWPGVLEEPVADEKARDKALLEQFEAALNDLLLARQREGKAMQDLLMQRVHAIREQVVLVTNEFPAIQAWQKQRILDRFEEINIDPDHDRLEQELVFLAQKSDIAEEIDRLNTHLDEIERILTKGGTVGRRLDFLMQELNREANTLGSKSISKITTAAAVEMKVFLEQMREQIQNIE
ncbi:MAG: YicC family protein, partial [Enterobacterales bacterium]|nr:YicC family protein [Enterobacterales bacterium]